MPLAQFVVAVLMTVVAPPNAFAQNCPATNVQSADQRARRDDAVQYLIAINTAQSRSQSEGGRFVALGDIRDLPSTPVGFIPKLLHDQWSYIVSLKDYFDACGFALFSDERGVIYQSHPRPSPTATDEDDLGHSRVRQSAAAPLNDCWRRNERQDEPFVRTLHIDPNSHLLPRAQGPCIP